LKAKLNNRLIDRNENQVIDFLKLSLIESGLDVKAIAIFGSHLKSKATDDSDIDLIIISDDFKNRDPFERAKMTMDAEIKTLKKFVIPLDVLNMTNSEYQKALKSKRFDAVIV
jgi:uncharacterized protein